MWHSEIDHYHFYFGQMALMKLFSLAIAAAGVRADTMICYSIANVETKLNGIQGIALGNLQRSVEIELSAKTIEVNASRDWNYTVAMKSEDMNEVFSIEKDEDDFTLTTVSSSPFALKAGFKTVEFTLSVPPECEESSASASFNVIPAYLTLLPLILTLVLAAITKNVIFSLFMGAYCGTFLMYDYNPVTALARLVDTHIPNALGDKDHAIVILFSWMLAGMTAVISKSGGAQGFANLVIKHGKSSIGGQFATFLMGFGLFFDDYANVLLVGNTARPITDALRVSRQKLAFIVDCTAAPIASIAPISSWVGYEISLIGEAFTDLELDANPWIAFIETIQYRFYPILLLVFVCIMIWTSREFGPMLDAERKAKESNLVRDTSNAPTLVESESDNTIAAITPRSRNAIIPIIAIACTMFFGLIFDGYYAIKADDEGESTYSLIDIFSAANSFNVLMWTGIVSILVPVILYAVQGIMKPVDTLSAWIEGMKDLMESVLVLILAWVFGSIMKQSQIAQWLIDGLQGNLSPVLLPAIVFLLGSAIALCTGSSWSTMAILMPIVVPLAWSLSDQSYDLLLQNIAAVLSGAVFGDHCSPISDTTVLTSLACRISVSDHVKTQLPYAFLVGTVSIIACSIPVATNSFYASYLALPIGMIILTMIVFLIGHKVPVCTANTLQHSEIVLNKDHVVEENACYEKI